MKTLTTIAAALFATQLHAQELHMPPESVAPILPENFNLEPFNNDLGIIDPNTENPYAEQWLFTTPQQQLNLGEIIDEAGGIHNLIGMPPEIKELLKGLKIKATLEAHLDGDTLPEYFGVSLAIENFNCAALKELTGPVKALIGDPSLTEDEQILLGFFAELYENGKAELSESTDAIEQLRDIAGFFTPEDIVALQDLIPESATSLSVECAPTGI